MSKATLVSDPSGQTFGIFAARAIAHLRFTVTPQDLRSINRRRVNSTESTAR